MPKLIVDVVCEVAVGIKGYALMKLSEIPVEAWGIPKPEKSECVKNDIEQIGFEDWVECNLNDVPTKSGVYAFAGRASFDEDSADYSLSCTNI